MSKELLTGLAVGASLVGNTGCDKFPPPPPFTQIAVNEYKRSGDKGETVDHKLSEAESARRERWLVESIEEASVEIVDWNSMRGYAGPTSTWLNARAENLQKRCDVVFENAKNCDNEGLNNAIRDLNKKIEKIKYVTGDIKQDTVKFYENIIKDLKEIKDERSAGHARE